MTTKIARYAIKWATLGALFLSATAQSQDVCSGTDAIAGTVSSVLEASGRVFVLTTDTPDHNGGGGLYISCNDGDSWHKHPMIDDGGNALIADPDDATTIYAAIGRGFVYVSRDAGASWTPSRPNETGSVSVTALATRPGGQVLVGMGTGGLLTSIDYGVTWMLINESLPAADIRAILVDAENSNRLLVAVANDGVRQSLDGGQSFSRGLLAGAILPATWDVRAMTFALADTSNVIVGASLGLFQSVDGGTVFNVMALADNVVDARFGSLDTNTLFVVSEFDGLLRSVDGGQSFTTHKPDLPRSTDRFRRAVQLKSGRLLIGTVFEGVYKSDDDGATWQIAGVEPLLPPAPPPPADVTANLSITVENLNGSAAIEVGRKAQFRVVVKNNGPDASTDTYVRFGWVRPNVDGGTSSKALELSSSNGNCAAGPNVETGCTFGTLDVGRSVTIEFSGTTSTDYIGTHSITATASNAQGAFSSANGSVSSKKSIACFGDCNDDSSGGGGSVGVMLLLILMLLARRYRVKTIEG